MKERIRFYLQAYFGFSRLEIQGFAVLLLALAFLVLSYVTVWFLRFNPPMVDNSKSLAKILANLKVENKPFPTKMYPSKVEASVDKTMLEKISNRPFNPNNASIADLQAHGMPVWLAQRIDKYRNKGGVFRKAEDLQKIYGFPPSLYAALKDLIILPQKPHHFSNSSQFPTKKEALLDLNTVDTTALMSLKGIGSKRSARIIKYREWLGGFHSLEQLYEIYGLDSGLVTDIKKHLILSHNLNLRQIHINDCTIEELKHPYLKPYIARAIINYRTTHGKFSTIQDLLDIKVLDLPTFNRLLPYLTL